MQRHKEPLEFAESPYVGTKHYTSPVLAAQRPCLASSISVELRRENWVSPQFLNGNESCGGPVVVKKKRQRGACKRSKTEKKRRIVHIKENLFPPLEFPSQSNETIVHCNKHSDDELAMQSSTQTNPMPLVKDIAETEQQQSHNIKTRKRQFLFSLGTPKPSTVSGEILVHETPENEMFESHILRKRLRNRNYNYF